MMITEFEASQQNVLSLPSSKKISPIKRKTSFKKLRESKHQLAEAIHQEQALIRKETTPVSANSALEYHQNGVQHRVLQRLKKGDYTINDTLDLHGYTLKKALTALSVFIHNAIEAQYRAVLIIHGKGLNTNADFPLLKNGVNQWLRAHPAILAFASAPIKYGGTGATLILLKRSA
jgi:DNA-nicking Smr family endonuclease